MIPEGWQRTELGTVAEIVTSGSRNWAQYYSVSGSKFIRMTNLSRDGIHLKLNDMKYVDVNGNSSDGKRTSLQFGDILISITAELGKIGWIPEDLGKAYINQHTSLIRLNKNKVDTKYIAYLLASNQMKKVINRLNDSGAKSGLNLSTIRKIPIIIASFPEQKKIAKILSTWDKAITTTEQLIATSQQQKKALMQQLLTGKKRLAGFDEEWRNKYLIDVAEVIVSPVDKKVKDSEIPVKLCNYTDVYYNTNITKNIRFMQATAKQSEIDKFTLQIDDVVITKDSETPGDIAVPALVSEDLDGVVCGYHLAIIRPINNLVSGAFLNQLFSIPKTRYYFFTLANGATRFGLSIGGIKQAHFSLPSIKEQQKIAQVLTSADQEIETLQQKLNFFKEEKKALMQQLLTGKRRVQLTKMEAENV